MTSHLEVEVKEKVLEIKINKPKVNAIDLKLSQHLGKAFAELRCCGSSNSVLPFNLSFFC